MRKHSFQHPGCTRLYVERSDYGGVYIILGNNIEEKDSVFLDKNEALQLIRDIAYHIEAPE